MGDAATCVWLRPAVEIEHILDCANRKGFFMTAYGLTLRSAEPLRDDQIREALLHLFRKVPTLRLCFRKREGILWACDMNREELDFQVLEDEEPLKVQEEMIRYQYPSAKGPLWCARLLPPGAGVRCSRPELGAAFPHTRFLILGNHHGIADGTTNNLVVDFFLQLLDDVISGKAIDDSVQMGYFADGKETKDILVAKAAELRQTEGQLQQTMEAIKQKHEAKKLIPRAFPLPQDPNYKCQIVIADLDKNTTNKFFRTCKQEGVTVNSGVTAAINCAIVDLVRETGLSQDEYNVIALHSVNMRRFWSGDTSKALGCNFLSIENIISTPAKWRGNFWDYARTVHTNLHSGLQAKDAALYILKILEGVNPEDMFKERPAPENEYGTANMGNIDRFILTEGDHVRLTYLVRSSSCWNDPMYHLFHTLRGCFMYSLVYANDILSRDNAQKLVDNVFDILKSVAQ